jgi:hypothetical protein
VEVPALSYVLNLVMTNPDRSQWDNNNSQDYNITVAGPAITDAQWAAAVVGPPPVDFKEPLLNSKGRIETLLNFEFPVEIPLAGDALPRHSEAEGRPGGGGAAGAGATRRGESTGARAVHGCDA